MGLAEILQQLAANNTPSPVMPTQTPDTTAPPTYNVYTDPSTGNTVYADTKTGSIAYTDTSTSSTPALMPPSSSTSPDLPPGSTVCYTIPSPPTPPTTQIGGKGAMYVKLLGRSRKVIQEGRRKYVNIKGQKVSITEARKMDKESKKKK